MFRYIKFFISTLVVALALQAVARCVFLLAMWEQIEPEWRTLRAIGTAFLRGLWLDGVVCSYVLVVPVALVGICMVLGRGERVAYRLATVWNCVLFTLVFAAVCGGIPYFSYFTRQLNSSIWNWAEYGGETVGMLVSEPSYWAYFALFAVLAGGFVAFEVWLLRRNAKLYEGKTKLNEGKTELEGGKGQLLRTYSARLAVFALLTACAVFGMRGRVGYNPIKVSASYFCTSPVLNNMGGNAMFCLMQTTRDDLRPENARLSLMDDALALRETQKILHRAGLEGVSPVARRMGPEVQPDSARRNVVFIFMESMSANLMGHFGNPQGLTPCLDSLCRRAVCFENFYSAGCHTNHALYTTLYGFPSIMKRNAMKRSDVGQYDGLPTVLRNGGYRTLFFMTHETQYDNMNAFFLTNGFDEVYGMENYDPAAKVHPFGVADRYLFEYALPVLRERAHSGQPFFATLLTISNHPPYVVPEEFSGRAEDPADQAVAYADAAVGEFLRAAMQEEWAQRTIFVLMGDHGRRTGTPDCELPEFYNHVPFILYAPGLPARQVESFMGQVDVMPTLLGLLQMPYVQMGLGVDAFSEPREMIYYTADNTVAARSRERLFVYNPEAEREFCYMLEAGKSPRPVAFSAAFAPLRQYVFAQLQATEWLVERKKVRYLGD